MSVPRIGIVYLFSLIPQFLRLGIIVCQFSCGCVFFVETDDEELTLLLDVLIYLLKILKEFSMNRERIGHQFSVLVEILTILVYCLGIVSISIYRLLDTAEKHRWKYLSYNINQVTVILEWFIHCYLYYFISPCYSDYKHIGHSFVPLLSLMIRISYVIIFIN